ncbi:MAG: ATP-binding protein [Candidatus Rokuibacteriota bacterium]
MASDGDEAPPNLAGRLRRVGEMLIRLSGSPVPTHLFQTLAEQAQGVVPHDYLAVCLEDPQQQGYLVHSLSGLPGEAVAGRVFTRDEGLPGRTIRTGRAYLVAELDTIADAAPDLDGVLVRAGLRAALTVPVRRGTEVPGALLFARRATPYTFDDLEVGTLVAAGLSGGLETCRAYQALADERGTLAAVLTSTADAVVMVGQDGIVLLANPATRAMLGVAPEALTGRPFFEAVPHDPLRRLLEAGRPGIAELALPDGRTAQASLIFVTTEYGEPVGLAAILRDITLLKDLEQMKTDFVNTVSHDLKSPIMAIAMTAELLLKSRPAPGGEEAYRDRCERILRSAKNMTELVTDLLDLGKIEAGLEGAGEPVDLVPLIAEVVKALAAQAEAKRIEVVVETHSAAPVRGVRARLAQVLTNLIGNALKYTREGGQVRVTEEAAAADGPIRIRVSDNGIGIPARDLPHVFDKFYRVKSDATAGIAGTGLGLAITRSIVEAHAGRIGVESTEGAGSTFWIELPRWLERPETRAGGAGPA